MGLQSSFQDHDRCPPNNYHYNYTRFQRVLKTWIACLASFSVSIAGGLLLTWWALRHHPTNSQLWMVPIGLILFITPLIIWLSLSVSYMFGNPDSQPIIAEANSLGLPNVQPGDALKHLVPHSPKREDGKQNPSTTRVIGPPICTL